MYPGTLPKYPQGTVKAQDTDALHCVPSLGWAELMAGEWLWASAQCPPQHLPPPEPSSALVIGSVASQRHSTLCSFVGTGCQVKVEFGSGQRSICRVMGIFENALLGM